jgi:succinate dehydrogenase / fumarate reductase cytochrome b subunit
MPMTDSATGPAAQPRLPLLMANRERPLSPHLQVYAWQVQMVTSILHRATGVVLVLGSLLIVWALLALAAGAEHWAGFAAFARSPLGFLILFGWSWAFAFHLVNGIRHLMQDAGLGYAVETFVRTSWISVVGSLVLTALIWLAAMTQWGGA